MGRGNLKYICWRCFGWGWKIIAFANLVIGFAGVPGDLQTWVQWLDVAFAWINQIMNDERVQHLAALAVEIADFVNQFWVRALLVIVGLAILGWGWRPFWNLRHRLWFRWRRALAEEVWINYSAAYDLLANSDWASVRKPSASIADAMAAGFLGRSDGLSPYQRSLRKFNHYLRRSLAGFAAANPQYARHHQGEQQFREDKLREFVDAAFDREVENEFGPIPNVRVD